MHAILCACALLLKNVPLVPSSIRIPAFRIADTIFFRGIVPGFLDQTRALIQSAKMRSVSTEDSETDESTRHSIETMFGSGMYPMGQKSPDEKDGHVFHEADPEREDPPSPLTTRQQILAVFAAFLVNMLTLGTTQSFGILQRHYGSDAAYRDGILPPDHGERRATIAAIGTLGNGGVVSAIGAWWLVPLIPRLGSRIKVVCLVAAFIMATGWGLAARSTAVSLETMKNGRVLKRFR